MAQEESGPTGLLRCDRHGRRDDPRRAGQDTACGRMVGAGSRHRRRRRQRRDPHRNLGRRTWRRRRDRFGRTGRCRRLLVRQRGIQRRRKSARGRLRLTDDNPLPAGSCTRCAVSFDGIMPRLRADSASAGADSASSTSRSRASFCWLSAALVERAPPNW